jgi:hypothetical protein
MVESHLVAGRQDLVPGKELTYGQSVTDGCINWEESVQVLQGLADRSSSAVWWASATRPDQRAAAPSKTPAAAGVLLNRGKGISRGSC